MARDGATVSSSGAPSRLAAICYVAWVTSPSAGSHFEQLVRPHRAELHAHCYRMLGSVADADDALQGALLGAWRGYAGFEGRSSLRAWLYRIATNACFQLLTQRPRRRLATEHSPAAAPERALEPMVEGPLWLEPYPDDPTSTVSPIPAS